ncbi:TlpA family protein disulfide reductase [Phnomibacter sp. MR]|uniref:TlpA family protein disulfide reductase n=1 Tax=Phnomibacter sp. MR TaxID=3042318 RepID=UPI003A7FD9A6
MKFIQTFMFLFASTVVFANNHYQFILNIQYQFSFPVDSIWLEYETFLPGAKVNKLKGTTNEKGVLAFSSILPEPAVSAVLKCNSRGQSYYKYFVLDTGMHHVKATNTARFLKFSGYRSINDQLFRQNPISNGSLSNLPAKIKQMQTLIRQHPQAYYSLVILSQMFNQQFLVSPPDVLPLWKALDSCLQETQMGLWLHERMLVATRLLKGNAFPDITLPTATGTEFNSTSMKGTNYLVVFGATWCGPCKQNLAIIKPLLKETAHNNLKVLHITLSSQKSDWEKMIIKFGLQDWTNVLDTATNKRQTLGQHFGISFIPFYLVVNEEGIIQYNSYQEYDDNLEKLKSKIALIQSGSVSAVSRPR